MDFRKLTASETTALLKTVAAERSDRTAAAFKGLRDALAAALAAAEESSAVEPKTASLVEPFTERLAAAGRADAEAEAARAKAAAQEQIDAIKIELTTAADARSALARELDQAQRELEKIQREAEKGQREAEKAQREAEKAQREIEKTQRQVEQQGRELEKARRDLAEGAEEQLRLKAAVQDAESAWADEVRAREAVETEQTELKKSAAQVRQEARVAPTRTLDRLIATFQKLEASKTAADVLVAVVDGLAAEFPRVALLEVRDDHLEATEYRGFGKAKLSKIDVLANSENSAVGDALLTRLVQSRSGQEAASDAGHKIFGGSPTFMLALPVLVRGEALAVIYVDDFGQDGDVDVVVAQRRVKYAQLVLWHAVPRLPRFVKARETTELCA